MSDDYPFTAAEYAKILGISKECLRGRRRAGKLEGEYIIKSNCYFYKRVGPMQLNSTPKKPPLKKRRRGVSYTDTPTKYKNVALQNANEAKMILKLQKRVNPNQLALVPEALALIQKQKEENQRAMLRSSRANSKRPVAKDYGGIYRPSIHNAQWRSLEPKPKKKQITYY